MEASALSLLPVPSCGEREIEKKTFSFFLQGGAGSRFKNYKGKTKWFSVLSFSSKAEGGRKSLSRARSEKT
jgi:hypothetical protein